jgi:tRNA(Met) C34 N-acetyltransferase TmcA
MFWQGIGVFILIVLCVSAVVEQEWLGLSLGLATLLAEAFWIRKGYAARGGQQ